jgi:hypothetical protein
VATANTITIKAIENSTDFTFIFTSFVKVNVNASVVKIAESPEKKIKFEAA